MELPKPLYLTSDCEQQACSNIQEGCSNSDETLLIISDSSSQHTLYKEDEENDEAQFDSTFLMITTDADYHFDSCNGYPEICAIGQTPRKQQNEICYESVSSMLEIKEDRCQGIEVLCTSKGDLQQSSRMSTTQVLNSEQSIYKEYLNPTSSIIVSNNNFSTNKNIKMNEKQSEIMMPQKKTKQKTQNEAAKIQSSPSSTEKKREVSQTSSTGKKHLEISKKKNLLVIESSDDKSAGSQFRHLVLPLHQIKKR